MKTTKNCFDNVTALYVSLSQEDAPDRENSSITNQKRMLRQYAIDRHFLSPQFYVDAAIPGPLQPAILPA